MSVYWRRGSVAFIRSSKNSMTEKFKNHWKWRWAHQHIVENETEEVGRSQTVKELVSHAKELGIYPKGIQEPLLVLFHSYLGKQKQIPKYPGTGQGENTWINSHLLNTYCMSGPETRGWGITTKWWMGQMGRGACVYVCVSIPVCVCMALWVSAGLCMLAPGAGVGWEPLCRLFSTRAWLWKALGDGAHQSGRIDTEAARQRRQMSMSEGLGTKSSRVPRMQNWLTGDWLSRSSSWAPLSTTAKSQSCTARTWNLARGVIPGFLHSWLKNLCHHPQFELQISVICTSIYCKLKRLEYRCSLTYNWVTY